MTHWTGALSTLILITGVSAMAATGTLTSSTTVQRPAVEKTSEKPTAPQAKGKKAKTDIKPASQATATALPSGVSQSKNSGEATKLWFRSHATVGALISSASDLSAEGATYQEGTVKTTGSGSMGTSTALGVTAQVLSFSEKKLGWFAAASLEQPREISTVNLSFKNGSLKGQFVEKPRFMPLVLAGGAAFQFTDRVYATGGLNYTIYNDFGGGSLKSASMDSKIGYQLAVGFKPQSRFSVEAMYRDLRYSFSGKRDQAKLTVDDFKLAGLNILARYSFE